MIAKFTVVQVNGVSDEKPTVEPWTPASSEHPALVSAPATIGVTTTDSELGEPVAVMRRGYLRAVDDLGEGWLDGDLLWAKSDATVTNVRPVAPLPQIYVGQVFQDEGGGLFTVEVNISVIPGIGELSGVKRETPESRDILIFRTDEDVWEPRQLWGSVDVSTNYTVDQHDYLVRADATGGNVVITLPPVADSVGMVLNVKKVDASVNLVTIDGDGTEMIDDTETFDLILQGENLQMQCDGVSWAVI